MTRTLLPALALLAACGGGEPKDPDATGTTTTPTGVPPTTTNAVPPRAENDLATVDEGGSTSVNVAANDLVTANPLALGSVTVVDPPQFGDVQVQANGTVDYTHDASETSADSFTYFIEDDQGLSSNVATAQITVSPVNDAPTAVADAETVDQWSSAVFDLAANDTDPDDGLDLASIAITADPTYGTVTVNGDGTVEYDQDGSPQPVDQFSYTIADVSGTVSNEVVVDVTINTSNSPPVAADDFLVVNEGGTINGDLAANDIDVDDGLDLTSIAVLAQPGNGTVTVNGDGTVDYVHDGSNSLSDVFVYTISDNSGAVSNTAAVQVAVLPVNDPPESTDDALTVDEGSDTALDVLANDSDTDGVLDPATVTVVSAPTSGVATVNPDGSIQYAHDGSEGASDSLSYTVDDDSGATSAVATVDLTIAPVNDPPTAADDASTVDEGSAVNVDLAANDSDPDDALDLGSIAITSPPSAGLVTVNGDGTVDYTHDGSETLSDGFSYSISDASGASSTPALVVITVNPVNDPPSANDDSATVAEGTIGTDLDVLANDTDADDGLDDTSVVITQQPANGTAQVNADGSIRYDHDGSNTPSDEIRYTVADLSGAVSNEAIVTVGILPVNDPPVASGDSGVVDEGSATNLLVLGNDSDSDDGLDVSSVQVVSAPSNGLASPNPDGSITYTHDGSETVADQFTYLVFDNAGAPSNQATVSLTVNPLNDAPFASNDSYTLDEGTGLTLAIIANDSDPDSALDPASVNLLSGPVNGTAVVQPDGRIQYTHDGSNTPSDAMTYTVDDVQGATSNIATIDITVVNTDDPPIAVDDSAVGTLVQIPVTANDQDDVGLDTASVQVVASPFFGTATVLPGGVIEYQNTGRQAHFDRFGYTVSDTIGQVSNIAWVDVAMNPSCTGSDSYTFTGSVQTFTTPDCAGYVDLGAWGAQGAGDGPGLGGMAGGRLLTRPGDTLYLYVGGQDGYNGGGAGNFALGPMNGGGASDVRLNGTTLNDRVLVAGGGGGGGDTDVAVYAGGDGGAGSCGGNYCGGGGGAGYGGAGGGGGLDGGSGIVATHSGGAGGGGLNSGGLASCQSYGTQSCGTDGTLGQGGNGDTSGFYHPDCISIHGGTRGGGGGFYGGGGTSIGFCGGGGGGGGSSWTGTLKNPVFMAGGNPGDGAIDVDWSEASTGLVGSFQINDGPAWATNPPVVSCLEACALLFGGDAVDYQCSTSDQTIDNQAFVDGYGDPSFCTTPVAEDFAEGYDIGYDCPSCSHSAFVSDHGCSAVNYCWR